MATLEKRGNGSWRVTVSGGYGPNGKQIRVRRTFHANPKSTENSQRQQAEKFASRLETEFEDKKVTTAKKKTFKAVYEDYIVAKSEKLAPQTIDSYKKLFNSRLLPAFGSSAIRDIDAEQIKTFLRGLKADRKTKKAKPNPANEKKTEAQKTRKEERKKLSGTYRLKYFQQLNELFRYAQKQGQIVVNPCSLIEDRPIRDTEEAQYYEVCECADVVKLIAACSDPEMKALFSLSFYCGTRPGELIGLNWSDYDGSNIFVRAGSYQRKGEKCKRTARPKTKKSVRMIQLTQEAVNALNEWKKAQAVKRLKLGEAWQEPDAVFTNALGERISSQTPSKAWKRFTEANKIRHLPLYDLRHTNCSLLISSRELSVEEVAARMGHEQTSTTLNIYSHAFATANERATQALENVLKAAVNQ